MTATRHRARRARYTCKICRRPSTTPEHPSCRNRQADMRRRAATKRRKAARAVVKSPKKAAKRALKKWVRAKRGAAGDAARRRARDAKDRVQAKGRSTWVTSEGSHHIQTREQARKPQYPKPVEPSRSAGHGNLDALGFDRVGGVVPDGA